MIYTRHTPTLFVNTTWINRLVESTMLVRYGVWTALDIRLWDESLESSIDKMMLIGNLGSLGGATEKYLHTNNTLWFFINKPICSFLSRRVVHIGLRCDNRPIICLQLSLPIIISARHFQQCIATLYSTARGHAPGIAFVWENRFHVA
jgi:hypothetical protein